MAKYGESMAPGQGRVKIGKYTLGSVIGKGAFGKVAIGVHERSGKIVAVKSLAKDKLLKGRRLYHLSIEIQNLKMFVRHPLFIKLYDVLFTPTHVFMIMEYADTDLEKHMSENPDGLPSDEARRFMQQIIAAVDFCHKQDIVHRDLKLSNILLDRYDNVKIADFGLSNVMTEGEFLVTFCGTMAFAPPEVHDRTRYIGPELDIWSCGVILYILLFNKSSMPFNMTKVPHKTKFNVNGRFTVPRPLEDSLDNLLAYMLEPNPDERATILDIRSNVWFSTDLPEEFFPLPSEMDSYVIKADIVQKICQYKGLDEAEVRMALIENDPDNEINQIYNLIATYPSRSND
ncbi:unnamed protein product, partial [Candidula unifasciata]